jgi:hypothetical protein
MTVSAQIAIYIAPGTLDASGRGRGAGIARSWAAGSSRAHEHLCRGEDDMVFTALREGFARASGIGHVVMTVTVSNACPIPD